MQHKIKQKIEKILNNLKAKQVEFKRHLTRLLKHRNSILKFKKIFSIKNEDRSSAYITTVVSLVGLIVLTAFPHVAERISEEQVVPKKVAAEAVVLPSKPDPFATVFLKAQAAVVYDDTNQKMVYEKNGNIPLPLASLTKIMTAITASEIAEGSTTITIQKDNLAEDGDTGLFLGEKWQLEKLLQYSLVVSSNDGASAIATALGSGASTSPLIDSKIAFIAKMNARAQTLGLENAVFFNETGLDESPSRAGAYDSAEDVSKMLVYAIQNHSDIFRVTSEPGITVTSENGIIHVGNNTDILTAKIPNLLAGKTGYTDLAGGNLAVAFDTDIHHTIVVVVLGSTYDGRFSDVNALVQAVLEDLKN